jgi:hypothetical protein
VVVSDAEPVLDNRHPLARAELEQRFIRTLDELDRLPQAIEEIRESLAELESRVGESGELSDRISDIHLLLPDLVDRAEDGFEAETPDDSQPAQAEPPRSFFATDDEMKREFPLLFGEGA